MIDWLEKIHKYSVEEVISFRESKLHTYLEPGTGIYFYSAHQIEKLVGQQEHHIQKLERRLARMKQAHDALYERIKRIEREDA